MVGETTGDADSYMCTCIVSCSKQLREEAMQASTYVHAHALSRKT
jgi:hypothetical protein